jgi:hypothetical protein
VQKTVQSGGCCAIRQFMAKTRMKKANPWGGFAFKAAC